MPSERKSATSRANGAKSHGPKTPQGRAISSANALRHGLTAKTLILPHENQDLFLAMWNAYFDLLRPANATEVGHRSNMVAARWRLGRTWRYKTAMLDVEMATRTDIHLTRIYRKAVDELRRLRGGNFLNEIPVLQNEPEDPKLTPLNATPDVPEISTEPKESRP
jgi:hypothetical protein